MTGKVLTEAVVLQKSKAKSLEEVHNVNAWGSQLSDVSIVARMPNVVTMALSVNEVASLEPFSHCPKLSELYLRKNKISSLRELVHLQKLPLRVLWLSDNPIVDEPDYRLFTIACLTHLTKLDEVEITDEERAKAKAKFPHPETMFESKSKEKSRERSKDKEKEKERSKEKESPKEKSKEKESPKESPKEKPRRSGGSVQGHILGAIEILIQDLDEAGLEVLADMVARRRK